MTSEIVAKIIFDNLSFGEVCTVIGYIKVAQLFDPNSRYICISNRFQQKGRWISEGFPVNKGDIHKIIFLEENSFVSFKDGKAMIGSSLTSRAKTAQ